MTTDIKLNDGVAQDMGEGGYVIQQRAEDGVAHSVVITRTDLELLLTMDGCEVG